MKNNIFYFLFFSFLFVSCEKTFDTPKEMNAFISDKKNGYNYSKEINGVDYVLQYRPTDLMVSQELKNIKLNNESIIEKLRLKYKKYLYFNLSMSFNNQELLNAFSGDNNKFGQMVNDLAFGMNEKIHLYTVNKDTLKMTDFLYPRFYGMSKNTSILIVYPRDEQYLKEESLNFVIEDLGFNTGDVTFKIKTATLKKEPQLRF